ncbi:methyltransferase-like protein 22 [Teleopsis dalmanni]|uniref:methyltransferase-like protein 22 n=1 Tax=Teleopsis dalmanni TaxID=139649 RepID=UPI0018CDA64F|nr:methyltransferase-like protein 22 [Teleopsis dalmanni]
MSTVSSEIYKETNFERIKSADGKVISKFKFCYPTEEADYKNSPPKAAVDKDGDFQVCRQPKAGTAAIEVEHSEETEIRLVGLQVWRGALLLADYLFHCRKEFEHKNILELGAGVGLTSIAAAVYVKQVVCTDVDLGGILNLIRANVQRNARLLSGNVEVLEYDFFKLLKDYTPALIKAIDESDIVLAADVIYDDDLTDAFIRVIDSIFERQSVTGKSKTIYVALEKRYVFTFSEFDAVAPMFEYFIKQTLNKTWHFEYIKLDFPQYFEYERCRELVLLKLTNI